MAHKLQYSASETSRIATFGSAGVILSGPVAGSLIDKTGYSIAIISSSLALSLSYFLFERQYVSENSNITYTCCLFFIIGCGSTFVNAAAIKCSIVTFPNMRGVATALPVAFYGISAMIYSYFGSVLFPGDTAGFLLFLSYSILIVSLITGPLICLCDKEHRNASRHHHQHHHQGTNVNVLSPSVSIEMRSLTSTPLQSKTATPIPIELNNSECSPLQLLTRLDFWLSTTILALLAGLGQMYIYSVGYIVTSLFGDLQYIQDNYQNYKVLVQQEQQLQVSIISIASCSGRLVSGFLADIFSNRFKLPRIVLLLVATSLAIASQVLGYYFNKLNQIVLTSALTGFAYGFTYCIFPILVGDLWGLANFSSNWGIVNMSPIITNTLLTVYFGEIYDSHLTEYTINKTKPTSDKPAETTLLEYCDLKEKCYNKVFESSFLVALLATTLAIFLSYYHIRKERKRISKTFTFED